MIPADVVRQVFFHFNIALTVDMQEMLIKWCTAVDSDKVLYHDLVNLLDWNYQPDGDTILKLTQSTVTSPPEGDATDGKLISSNLVAWSPVTPSIISVLQSWVETDWG